MKRKIITAIALFTVLISIFGTALEVTPIRAEELPEPTRSRIEGTGTYFEINNSRYLNVSITSSEVVHMLITVPGDMVDYAIESASGANSTTLTLNNLKPNFTYYMFEDSYTNEETFSTDSAGSYTYVQDISEWHDVFIQEERSTVYINASTVLTADIQDTVEINSSNVVLDLNGHYIDTLNWVGILINRKANVTIKNGCVRYCGLVGIRIDNCSIVRITNVTVTLTGDNGVDLIGTRITIITGSTISECFWTGIEFSFSPSNSLFVNNTIQHNRYGLSGCYPCLGTVAYHNNFIDNNVHVIAGFLGSGTWDNGYPSGGNYWSGISQVDVKRGPSQNQPGSDGIRDTQYEPASDEIDHYPLMCPYCSTPMCKITILSAPVQVTFNVTGMLRTTPYQSEPYTANVLISLEMPALRTVGSAKYYWSQWSDGDPSRTKVVDLATDITLTGIYTGPYYELTATSSPTIGIQFTLDGNAKTTPYTDWMLAGSHTLEMPQTYDGYVWWRWLEDGDTNRIKTITLSTNTTWTGMFAVETATGSGTVTFLPDAGTVENLIPVDESTLPTQGKPALEFPHGFFSFNVTGLTPGQAVSLTITFPTSMPVGTQYWKCQAGVWSRIPVGDDDGDKVLVITLTDGWIGDADGVANGRINDPGGFGVPPPPAPVGGFSYLAGGYSTEKAVALYLGIVAVLAMTSAITRRKAHRETKQS